MSVNYETYKQKALEACKNVFENEYNRSIGLPLPQIEFILPDSSNYKSGEYYIRIGDTWQIHLNFGLLPVSYKEFQEEVRVLTRHEVEHYMCCPFDVLSHFRMLKVIIDTYRKNYSQHQIDIVALAGSLSNQASDIIIDSKNFFLHREETLKSEIAWIKKIGSTAFNVLPRHSKLMFLVKEAIWEESLELNEEDKELIEEVKSLAFNFKVDGITNKDLFIEKTIAYTHSFFKLFAQDKNEEDKNNKHGSRSKSDQDPQIVRPQMTPSKDSQEGGNSFVFQSPDKVQEALAQLAQETSIEQFSQIISAAGISSLSEKEKQRIWFVAQEMDMIPIIEKAPKGSNDNYSYPTAWKLGDPLEQMDMMLSFATSPVIIPGLTTKKWVQNAVFSYGSERKEIDLLLVVDTSGSMGSVLDSKTTLHQAILASYGIIKYFETKSQNVSLIGFSDKITVYSDWSKNYDYIRELLLVNGSGGTNFPIQRIEELIGKSKNPVAIVVITDGEIQNIGETVIYFKEYLSDGNKLFIFLQDKKSTIEKYKILINYGAFITKAITAEEMKNTVLNEIM